jgi:hypothetical protein
MQREVVGKNDVPKQEAYAIVSNTNVVLVVKMVNEKIAEGYRPLGGVCVSPSGFLYQALELK